MAPRKNLDSGCNPSRFDQTFRKPAEVAATGVFHAYHAFPGIDSPAELVQEMFLKLQDRFELESGGEWTLVLPAGSNTLAYLRAVAHSVMADRSRKTARDPVLTWELQESPESTVPSPASAAGVREEILSTQAAIASLSKEQREVVSIACLEDKGVAVAAKELGIPRTTGYSRLKQAKEVLRNRLRGLAPER